MSELAPIGVSTYIRLQHLKKTIFALKKNTLATQSRLFVFSDAAKVGDEEKVRKVREYLHTIEGFKDVTILERKKNSRIKNNRGGIQQLLAELGKCIFMEEDVVTAPGFLEFINKGLEFYKDDKSVISIGGHTPNLYIYNEYQHDMYFIDRFHGWGFGTWKDRYDLVTYIPEYNNIKKNKAITTKLKNMGSDMLPMIKLEAEGKIDAWDLKACYLMADKQMVNILPVQTLVMNIGLDGTGVHCGNDNPYISDTISHKETFVFLNKIKIDPLIKVKYRKFYTRSLFRRLLDKLNLFNI